MGLPPFARSPDRGEGAGDLANPTPLRHCLHRSLYHTGGACRERPATGTGVAPEVSAGDVRRRLDVPTALGADPTIDARLRHLLVIVERLREDGLREEDPDL